MEYFGVEYVNKLVFFYCNKKGKIRLFWFNNLSNCIFGGGLYVIVEDLFKFG